MLTDQNYVGNWCMVRRYGAPLVNGARFYEVVTLCVDDNPGTTTTASKNPSLDDSAVKQLFHVKAVAKPPTAAAASPSPQLAAVVPAKHLWAGPPTAQDRPTSSCSAAPCSSRALRDVESTSDTSAAAYLARPGLLRRIRAEQKQRHGPAAFQRGAPPAKPLAPAKDLTSESLA